MCIAVRPLFACAIMVLVALRAAAAATDHYEKALIRFNEHDYEGAVLELKTELASSPDNLSALVLLGRALLRTGRAASAEQALLQAQAAGADDTLTVLPLARAYVMQRKFEALLEGISTGGLSDTLRAELVSMQGEAQVALQRYDDAKASFDKAKAIDPLSPAPFRGKARLALAQGRHHAAAKHTEKAILLGTEDEETWFLDAEARRLAGNIDKALKSYGKAVSLAPRYIEARVARAATLIDLGREDEALTDIEQVLTHAPNQPQALYLKAMLLVRDGKVEEAASVLDKAADFLDEASPQQLLSSAPMLLLAGVTANAQGRLEVARARLEQFVEIEPRHAAARQLLGSVLVRQGDPNRALYILKPALTSRAGPAELHATVAVAYRQIGNYPESITAFKRAIEHSSDPASLRIELARTQFMAGQQRVAMTELEAIAKLDHPLAPTAGVLLARLKLEVGERREAIATIDAVLARDPQNLPALLLRGDAQLASSDVNGARESYASALAIAPDNPAPRYGLANADLATGRTQEAAAQLETILERHPEQVLAMIGLARVAMAEQRIDDAVRWLEKARAKDRSSATAHLELVELHLQQGNASEALNAAQRLNDSVLEDARAYLALGRSQAAMGDNEAAKATYASAVWLASATAQQLTALARAQLALKDVDGARASLAAATAKDPYHFQAHAMMVAIDVHDDKLKAAMDRASRLRQRHPDRAIGAVLVGDVRMAAGDAEGAIKAYLEAVQIRPDDATQVKLHRARWQAGRKDAALEGLEAWVASHPDSLDAGRALAGAYLASGRLKQAQTLHEQLVAANPQDFELINNLAWLYQTTGDERALATAKSAYSIAPKEPATLDTYGWILMESGQLDEALKILRQAQALAPQEPWVQFHAAVALSRLGRRKEARELLESLLASKAQFDKRDEARALLDRLSGG